MATAEKFQEAKERMRAAKREATEIAKDAFKEGAAEVFAAHPTLESFGWTQYTPYFDDGDACTFSTNTDEIYLNGERENDAVNAEVWRPTGEVEQVPAGAGRTYPREKYGKVPNPDYDPALAAANEAALDFLRQFDEDDFKELFGDHMQVTVDRDGRLETEEYEHD